MSCRGLYIDLANMKKFLCWTITEKERMYFLYTLESKDGVALLPLMEPYPTYNKCTAMISLRRIWCSRTILSGENTAVAERCDAVILYTYYIIDLGNKYSSAFIPVTLVFRHQGNDKLLILKHSARSLARHSRGFQLL